MRIVLFVGLALLAIAVAGAAWLYTPDEPRAALEATYAGPPSQFLDVAGLRLHVRDTGPRDAPVLILLHGFGSSLHTWDAWAADLEHDVRVIRYDEPGFGLTGPDPTGDYSDTRAMAVLSALMDRLGVARATLIGHSMGGRIAWRFAAAEPQRVQRLVLISPDGFAGPGDGYGTPTPVDPMMRLLPYTMPEFLFRQNLAIAFADPAKLTPAMFTRYRDMMLAPGVRAAIVARMAQEVKPDPVPLLRQIQAPTLLMWGERDGMIPFANAADYMAALPHATLAALPGLGHVPFEEAPAASLARLRAFLGK
jgi:pimeloyl-ACP methyl ester carboxylesterase